MSDEDKPCTLTLPDGTHYDLNPLASSSADYVAQVGETSYKLNVCRNVVSEVWTKEDADKVAGFVSRPSGDFSIGQVNTALYATPDLREPLLVYSNGSVCPNSPNDRATTVIRFICSPTDFHAGKPVLIAAVPPGKPEDACHFVFEWRSHVACPSNRKTELETGHYIAFGSILLIAILTWFLGHTLYNRFFLKRRGRDIFPFPHFSNFKIPSLPSRPRAGGSAAQSGPKWGSWRRSTANRSGYSGIRADEHDHDEQEGFAGRFSLDDDEIDEEERGAGSLGLGEDRDAWRDIPGRDSEDAQPSNGHASGGKGKGKGKVGVHQGLTHV